MQPFNRSFIPPHSSADPNQSSNPTRPVSPVLTRPTSYGSGFVDFNQHNTGFMILLNQPLDPPILHNKDNLIKYPTYIED
ncbi:hypothetical protein Hanom_Chr17g01561371 [Helianthus anomalus]